VPRALRCGGVARGAPESRAPLSGGGPLALYSLATTCRRPMSGWSCSHRRATTTRCSYKGTADVLLTSLGWRVLHTGRGRAPVASGDGLATGRSACPEPLRRRRRLVLARAGGRLRHLSRRLVAGGRGFGEND
jgi:hypothetical protein